MKTKSIVLGLLLMCGTSLQAQKKFNFSLHLAPAMGEFKKGTLDDFNSKGAISSGDPFGFAGTGGGLGIEYRHPIGTDGFNILIGLDAYRNGVKNSLKKVFEAESVTSGKQSVSYSSYFNIPLSAGVHYQRELKESLHFFGQFSFSYDFLKITDSYFSEDGFGGTIIDQREWEYGLSKSSGFGLKIGLEINNKYTVGIGYRGLGEHTVQSTRRYTLVDPIFGNTEVSTGSSTKKISMLNLSVGILL